MSFESILGSKNNDLSNDSRLFQISFKIAFRKLQGLFMHISWMFESCFMGVWHIFQGCLKLKECFKRTSKVFQKKFIYNSRFFQEVLRVYQQIFKEVSRNFKNVSLVFQTGFMAELRKPVEHSSPKTMHNFPLYCVRRKMINNWHHKWIWQ